MTVSPHFIGIDGEGITEDGVHRYVMLCSSEATNDLVTPDGIDTETALDWLLYLAYSHPKAIIVSYAFGYDTTMILQTLIQESPASAMRLWRTGYTRWGDYRIQYYPGKWLYVKHRSGFKVRVFDVFGFWQSRFVKALESLADPEVLAYIQGMKDRRNEFTEDDLEAMYDYCKTECRYLARLCEWLNGELGSVGIDLSSWHGPGAIASDVLRMEGVREYHVHTKDIPAPLAHGYFGGRMSVSELGTYKRVTQYDINSAYPWVLQGLPTSHGDWHRSTDLSPYGLYKVRFRGHGDIPPFPFRKTDGSIRYPDTGVTFVWTPELETAIRYYPEYDYEILDGWVFHPSDDARPFAFVNRMYESRMQLKARGVGGQLALKLAMNSLYGKLAQTVTSGRHAPRWQNHFWAGMITSRTRARLLELAAPYKDRVIAMATDGIFFNGDVDYDTSVFLGGLSRTDWDDFIIVQPGVYHGFVSGEPIERTRSFMRGGLDWDSVRALWSEYGCLGTMPVARRQFIGLALACSRNDPRQAGQWVDSEVMFRLATTLHPNAEIPGDPRNPWADTVRGFTPCYGDEISQPYKGRARTLLPVVLGDTGWIADD